MKFDFALLLTALSALTGLIWLADRLFLARARKLAQGEGEEVAEPVVVDYARSLFPVLFFVLILRSFIAEPFRIPSSSMMPTLLIGDFILVNKFDYGLRLPVANSKFLEVGAPERGDVVVFRYPGMGPDDPTAGTDYIKRVIGLPGDTISVMDNRITVNGSPVGYEKSGIYVGTGRGREMTGAHKLHEDLPGRDHDVLFRDDLPFLARKGGSWTVPAGHFFVMGDNRDHSEDSRVWGFVPEQNLVGRAMVIWLNCEGWFCSGAFDYSRIGDTIR